MIKKGKYKDEAERDEWLKVMSIELMSSEESECENEEDVIVVHPLPWLSEKVVTFKANLDLEIRRDKTPQARRQMKRRVIGSPSSRKPSDALPPWALEKQ